MGYFKDLREHIAALDQAGLLVKIDEQINKDTELMPLMRLQYRGIADEKRRAFLFENVLDSRGRRHAIKVATGMYGCSREIAAFGLGCLEPLEIYEKWRQAFAAPVEPQVVNSGPVQQQIYTGKELAEFGITNLPAPVEEPGFSGGIRRVGMGPVSVTGPAP